MRGDRRDPDHAGGFNGSGFSAQLPAALIETIPAVLRQVAAEIEADGKMEKAGAVKN